MFKRYPQNSGNSESTSSSSGTFVAGTGVRQQVPPRVYEKSKNPSSTPYSMFQQPSHKIPESPPQPPVIAPLQLEQDEPDTTLGEGVVFKGELTFKRLLRIDGHFEGELVSEGKLIIGPTGIVKSNIRMYEAIIEGRVEGNVTVTSRLELRREAEVIGDIKAASLSVDEGVSIVGHVAVTAKETDSCIEEPLS